MGNNKIYIILMALFLLVFAGTGLIMTLNNKSQTPQGVSTTVKEQQVNLPTVAPKEGSMTLKLTTGTASRFTVGQTVTIEILADSNNENIVGWDTLVSYDPASLAFVSATSGQEDFKIYSYKREKHVSLTSIKSLSSKTDSVYKDTAVATLVFRTVKSGSATVTLKPEIGREKTNFVNTVTKRIYPKLNSINIGIQ